MYEDDTKAEFEYQESFGRKCENCGDVFWKRERESSSDFVKRKLCSDCIRNCERCGKAYKKRRTESAGDWKRRRFCSRACVAVPIVHRDCEQCGKQFKPRPGEVGSAFATRRFCSVRCVIAMQVKNAGDKYCKTCKVKLEKKPGEKPSQYFKRDYCSRACTSKANCMKAPKRIGVVYAPKVCAFCGETFKKKKTDPAGKWAKRVCCSRQCADDLKQEESDKIMLPVEEIYRRAAEIRAKRRIQPEEDIDKPWELREVSLNTPIWK